MMRQLVVVVVVLWAGIAVGAAVQFERDKRAVVEARQNEAQANGLEDECKAALEYGTKDTGFLEAPDARGYQAYTYPHPPSLLTRLPNGGWKLEHVAMPACPDRLRRTVDIPEQDEVDALTVNCGVGQ